MKALPFAASLLVVFSSSVTFAGTCASYRPTNFSQLYELSKTTGVEKGEYETTPQWQQRVSKVLPVGKEIVAATKVPKYEVKYDADKNLLTVTTGLSMGRSFSSDESFDFDTFGLGTRYWLEPGYVGRNAMGVARQISVAQLR